MGRRMSLDAPSPARPRFPLIDALRGVAIIAMVVFHLGWDLYYLGFWNVDVTTDPWWTTFQKSIVSSFLALAGVSLWLGHGAGIRWRSFWRRETILVLAALAVSAGTWFAFGDYFAFFGVLHAIALFSLLALPFLRLPPLLTGAVGVGIVVLPLLFTHPAMRERWLAWIGFWPIPPATADIVPLFPWLGVMLLGLAAAKAFAGHPVWRTPAPRWLAWLGRWSLVIYLLHQPLMYGTLYGLQSMLPAVQEDKRAEEFLQSCRATRGATEADAAKVERYCGCTLEQLETGQMWELLARERTAEEELELQSMVNLCEAMSTEPIADVPLPAQ